MPSPFPGMDPYLESPSLWPDVHDTFITVIRELLAPGLRPSYFCQIEERVYVVDDYDPVRDVIIPDVVISQVHPGQPGSAAAPASTAVAEPILVMNFIDEEIHEPLLQIIDAQSREVVTVIEVLSPTNKIPRSNGMASYRKKREEVLQSTANWVEIDLLRAGRRARLRGRFRESDYRMHWSRAKERPKEWVLPVSMAQPLPKIPIPLRPKHPEAELDLQAVLNLVYDRAGYDLILDYRRDPPEPPLTDAQRQLVQEVLKTLRNSA